MYRSRILPAALAAAIAIGAGGTAFAESDGDGNAAEIAAVLAARTSFAQAISAAERETGGRAMKISVEEEKGTYLYEVKTVSADKIADVFVDPESGQVLRTDEEGLFARLFDEEDKDTLAELSTSPTTLAAAIAAAERHTGGDAVEAGFNDNDGVAQLRVEIAIRNVVHDVTIDSATGQVLNVAAQEHVDDDYDGD